MVERSRKQHKRKKRRVVSGVLLEEGESKRLRGLRGGDRSYDEEEEYLQAKQKKRVCE